MNTIRHHINALNYKIVMAKHRFNDFFSSNWLKIGMIAFVFYLGWSKDIQLSVGLSAGNIATNTQQNRNTNAVSTSYKVRESGRKVNSENGHANPSIPQAANTFSNLGFILNPNYTKKHKVDPKVINYHNNNCRAYVDKYAAIARDEMIAFNIPASIKLAQGLLESNAGDSRLAKNNNNHFGIKCFSKKCRKGHCSNFTDDSHKDFFRKYKSPRESYRAHSQFLQKKRYAHLKSLGTHDYKAWAYGLKRAGYATDKYYAEKLIRIIEKLQLHKYDKTN